MSKINVKKPFILNLPTGHVSFSPGVVDVENEVAEHWYVKVHSEPAWAEDKLDDVLYSVPDFSATFSREEEFARALAEFEQYEPEPPGAVKRPGRKKKDK